IANLTTGENTSSTAAADGSFDARVDGSENDVFVVRAGRDGTQSSSVYVVRGGAVVGGDDGALSCEQRVAVAVGLANALVRSADVACQTAAHCRAGLPDPRCIDACNYAILSQAGVAALATATDAIDSGLCAREDQLRCSVKTPACPAPPVLTCDAGRCARLVGTMCRERENAAGEQLS